MKINKEELRLIEISLKTERDRLIQLEYDEYMDYSRTKGNLTRLITKITNELAVKEILK